MKMKVAIILGSVREGRQGERVARWIQETTRQRESFEVELLDLEDYPMPFYAHPKPTMVAEASYEDEVQRRWTAAITRADAFILVTPEYNHGYPAVLKNALDYAYAGWNRKPVALVSYGGLSGGIRAAEQLRLVAVELQMVPIRNEVNIPMVFRAFDEQGQPVEPLLTKRAAAMLDMLEWWSRVLQEGRTRYPG